MNGCKEMSAAEQQLMEALWQAGEPQTLAQLAAHFPQWKVQTIATFLTRLQEKGLLTWTRTGRTRHFSPALRQQEYQAACAQSILDQRYQGSLKNLVLALYDGDALPARELDELRRWLADK